MRFTANYSYNYGMNRSHSLIDSPGDGQMASARDWDPGERDPWFEASPWE